MNQKGVRSVVAKSGCSSGFVGKVARLSENGQGDYAASNGGDKENLIPLMFLVGLISTSSRSKKSARTLADKNFEMEVTSQCGSGGPMTMNPREQTWPG